MANKDLEQGNLKGNKYLFREAYMAEKIKDDLLFSARLEKNPNYFFKPERSPADEIRKGRIIK